MAIDDNTSYELTGYQVKDLAQKIRAKADSASLASVATSGLYSDLTGAPTIPTVYNGTLTITQGGNTLGTFTANSSTNETIDIPAGGSSYTAGTGIDITNDTISIDHTVVAELSDLPTVNDATLTVTQNGTSVGTFTANSSTNTTIALTDTTYSAFTGTDGQTAGTAGLVPAPATTDAGKFLKADGTWDTAGGGSWAGQKVFYGTSTTGQFYNDRDVTTSNDFVLETGTVLIVKFSYANNSSIIYLTVNNDASTRKQVMQGGAVPSGKVWKNNEAVTFVYDGTYWQLQKGEANTTTYGLVKLGSGYTSQDSYTVPTNAQLYDVYTIANGKKGAVTYYATSDNTQGFPTFYTYLYSDSARTIVVTPDTILNNFENGDTILIEYESTQTGSSAYKMTLAIETVAKVGADGYRMNVSEINVAAGSYNQVGTQFMATWDGQSPFNGRWVLVRNPMPVVNDGTLTIQHNGTTKGTFTANQSSASTVNIETIYADDYISTSPIPTTVTTAMIEDGAVTAAKIDDGAVTAAKTAFGGNYSTTEVNTGFTWIDGKPIYKKTVYKSSISSGDRDTAHGISNISKVIRHEAFFVTSGTYKQLPIFANTSGGNHACVWGVNSTAFNTVSTMVMSDFYITIWYTKTTD